jgi:hypothetical protein
MEGNRGAVSEAKSISGSMGSEDSDGLDRSSAPLLQAGTAPSKI